MSTTTPQQPDRIVRGADTLEAPPALPVTELTREPTPAEVEAWGRSGVGVVRGLLGEAEVAEIREVYQAAGDRGPVQGLSDESMLDETQAGRDAMLRRFPRMLHPHRHRHRDRDFGELAWRWMFSRRIAAVLRALMGEEPLAAQSMFYFTGPGARGQALHQDNVYLSVAPATCMAAWIAIDDCDEENGALAVVPGTGGWRLICDGEERSQEAADEFWGDSTLRLPEGCEPVTARMKAGDVLFFNGSVVHGSYRNRSTTRFRRSLIFHYAPSSCEEIAEFYHPMYDMQGREVARGSAAEGGPCGGGGVAES